MFNFDHLEPQAERTHAHTMHGVHWPRDNPKPVVLHLKFCGRRSPYWNASLKLKQLSEEAEESKRMATLFARYGVHGWDNVGVPYSSEAGAQMFAALIEKNRDELVIGAFSAACNADNFTDPVVEAAELGKK